MVAIICIPSTWSSNSGWNDAPDTQYHIQTDEGPERYFRYQTMSGQYRKEKRLEDGTVIGTYGWVDANGYLRMRDYIADNQGYRILKSKNVFVGKNRDIGNSVNAAKNVPAEAGVLVTPSYLGISPKVGYSTSKPYTPIVQISHNGIPSSTIEPPVFTATDRPATPSPSTRYLPSLSTTPKPPITPVISNDLDYAQEASYKQNQIKYNNPYIHQNGPTYPIDRNGNTYNSYTTNQVNQVNQVGNGYDPQFPYYDGIAVTNDGFRYYLPRQYHEEQNSAADERAGSFGYIDPFGIRRVIYYNTAPGTGFQHRKNNRYVGFGAQPYDPRPYR